ncbi:MAG: hypothetical protein ACE5OZ_01040 [Candidatus Heimdallarchaeota archaeon]
MYAKYRCSFRVNSYLKIKGELQICLEPFNNAELVLHPSDGTANTGKIQVKIRERDEKLARSYANEALRVFFDLISIQHNTHYDSLQIETCQLENPEDWESKPKVGIKILPSNAVIVGPFSQGNLEELSKKLHLLYGLDRLKQEHLMKFLRAYAESEQKLHPNYQFQRRWSALDVIISDPHNLRMTPNAIRNFICQRFPVDKAKEIIQRHQTTIDILAQANLHKFRASATNYSNDLAAELKGKRPDMKKVLELILLCLYEIKNSISHRSEIPTTLPDISQPNRMLKDILIEFWKFQSSV